MDLAGVLEAVADRRLALPPINVRRAIRVAAGVTQGEVGALVGVTKVSICRYEAGKREPRGERRVRYVEALEALRRV